MKPLPRAIIAHQALAAVIIGVFLFPATFGMTFGMQADEQGNMSNCPFMSEQTLVCSMGVFEHIAKWQQLFTAAFSQSSDLATIVFLLLTLVFLAVFARAPNISPRALSFSPPIPQNKPETKLFNHLVAVFSQGILNPKIY